MADVCYKDPLLLNWLQCAYAVRDVKTFLTEHFVESEVRNFHGSLFTNKWDRWCTASCQTAKGIQFLPRPCQNCKQAVEAIELQHAKKHIGESWTNCDWKELQTQGGHCQLAKLFMPKVIKKEVNDLKKIDATGIFNLCSTFKPLHNVCGNLKQTGKMTKFRNLIMHSGSLKVEKQVKDQMLGEMIAFLADLQRPEETKAIREKLETTKDTTLEICTEQQMEEAVYAVQTKLECIEERISRLEEENGDGTMGKTMEQELQAVKNLAENSPILQERWRDISVRADSLSKLLVTILERLEKQEEAIAENRDGIAQNKEEIEHNKNEIAAIKEKISTGKKSAVVSRHGDHVFGGAGYGAAAAAGANVNVLNITGCSNFQIGNTYNFYGNSAIHMGSHPSQKTAKIQKYKGHKKDQDGDRK